MTSFLSKERLISYVTHPLKEDISKVIDYEKSKIIDKFKKYYMLEVKIQTYDSKLVESYGRLANLVELHEEEYVYVSVTRYSFENIAISSISRKFGKIKNSKVSFYDVELKRELYPIFRTGTTNKINIYANLTEFHLKSLLLIWWKIWKKKGLISDCLYNVYLFLIDKDNPFSDLIYSSS